jgi:tRNA-2-methylthio-N6-dimethylallyladenosine synthase
MKKIYLETFGCQMNVLDSELVENQLRILGYDFTPDLAAADVVLYNTCSVRERSEQKVWSRLGLLRERKAADPALVIGVIGCMAERDGLSLMKRMPYVDLMCGPSELDQLPALLDNVLKTGRQQHALAGNTSRRSKTLDHAEQDGLELLDLARAFSPTGGGEQRSQAYIRIVRGCNKFCTYCVVPYTRGPEVSRSPQAIFEEARRAVDAGCLEITLLGQTVNHYVYESDTQISTSTGPARRRTTFAELLRLLHDQIPNLPRLRFITSFPADFGDDILHAINDCPRICRYLHIPAQSGSNRILKMMNRGYTVESYFDLLARARAIVPGIQFAGDMIVGFPTESDEDYQASRALVRTARYKNCFIFKYSPRPGTIAIKRFDDDISEEVKRHRNNDLLRLQNTICFEHNQQLVGRDLDILCAGPSGWTGRSGDEESVISGQDAGSGSPGKLGEMGDASPVTIELGSRLAAAVRDRPNGARLLPAAANATDFPRAPHSRRRADWVQLTGRTTADQIVVFDGPVSLAGSILSVRVREAHGMTVFAEILEASEASLVP